MILKTMTGGALTLSVALLATIPTANAAVASSSAISGDVITDEDYVEFDDGLDTNAIVIQDYTKDGVFVSETIVELPNGDDKANLAEPGEDDSYTTNPGETELGILGTGTSNPPAGNSGCRWVGIYQTTASNSVRLGNRLYFCWNKSTKKVSSAKCEWVLTDHGQGDSISLLNTSKDYYKYHGSISNSGYYCKRQWHVEHSSSAGGVGNYYPRIDLYAHGNGTLYWSKDSGY